MAVTVEELREICRQYLGAAWFSQREMTWVNMIPAILGELDSCSDERVIEIAHMFNLI